MDNSEQSLARSFDKGSSSYDAHTDTFHHKIGEHVLSSHLLRHLGSNKAIKVLDAGGGTGKFSLFLARQGFEVTLIDISPQQVEVAKRKFALEGVEVPCFVGNCENSPFESGSFDFIVCVGAVFSYTAHPELLLGEFHRILKKGGKIFFDYFNAQGWAFEATDVGQKLEWSTSENLLIQMEDWDYPARILSLEFVRNLVGRSGFQILREYGLVSLSHTLPIAQRYTKSYDAETLQRYQRKELQMSNSPECLGTSWSCIVYARKST